MKKLTVSVGIPAYNEEANIKKLLLSIIHQAGDKFTLLEIIVVSDGSTDNTVQEVKSVKNNRIILIDNKNRTGQAEAQNEILKLFTGDVLVLLNADVLPADNTYISELIFPFETDEKIGLVGSKIVPLKAETFFEHIINCSISFKDAIFEKWRNGNNLHLCSGRGRAFRKDFAKSFHWNESLSEDAFSYLSCVKAGYKFKYVPAAILYFKSPDNFKDHLRQSARFTQGPKIMSQFIDPHLVKQEYSIPKKLALLAALRFLIKRTWPFLCYLAIFTLIKINPKNTDFAKSLWETAISSKVLKRL